MTSYSSDASRSGARSPLFGTATFSTLTQSESSPTRYSYSSRSGETSFPSLSISPNYHPQIPSAIMGNIIQLAPVVSFALLRHSGLFLADTSCQESLLMIAISLEPTCVESQSLHRSLPDILARTCTLGPRRTQFMTQLRLRRL